MAGQRHRGGGGTDGGMFIRRSADSPSAEGNGGVLSQLVEADRGIAADGAGCRRSGAADGMAALCGAGAASYRGSAGQIARGGGAGDADGIDDGTDDLG